MPETPDVTDLKKRSVRGGMITITTQVITVVTQIVSTVVLARMLTPDDYGVMGMVLSIVALAALFKDLGLSSAAIQRAELTDDQRSNLFWINAFFGLLLGVAFAAAAPLVAWFYGRPELVGMTLILSLTFVLGGLGAQHNAMLVRHMQFGRQGIVNISGIAVTFAVSVALAYFGFRFWALAWGHVAGTAARTLLIWALAPFMPGRWKRGIGTLDMLRFGANVTGFNFVNYFSRNLDNILIGKFVGADALGIYSRAYQLMLFPIQNLRGPIGAVTYPALCRLQDKPEDWRKYHMQTLRVLAFLTMPLVAWMYLVSEPLILLLLGENWAGVIPLFRILAIVAFIQPCAGMVGSVMLSVGHSREYFVQGVATSGAITLAFAVGIFWGATGIALGYLVANYLVLIPLLAYAYKGTALKIRDFFDSVSLPAFLALASLGVSYLFLGWTDLPGLAGKVAVGSAFYFAVLAAAILLHPNSRRLLTDLVKKRRGGLLGP